MTSLTGTELLELRIMPSVMHDHVNAQSPLPEEQTTSVDLVGFLKRRKSFVILFALLGVGVSYMMFQRQVRQYRSEALVQVIHSYSDAMLQSMMAEKDLTDADFVIKSPKTLTDAYRTWGLGELATLRGLSEEDAVARMAQMLSTKSLTTNIVAVSVTGAEPGDVKAIANAASEEYVKAQTLNYVDASKELLDILAKARDEYLEDLGKAEREYSEFRKASRLTGDGENPYRQAAQAAYEKVSALELQETELKARLAELEAALARGESREAILLLVGKDTTGTAASASTTQALTQTVDSAKTMAEALFPLLREEAKLSAEVGADHPKLKKLRLEIEMTRNHIQNLAGIETSSLPDEAPVAEPDFLSVYLDSMRQDLLIIERQQAEFRKLADEQDALARELMQDEIEDANRRNEIDRYNRLGIEIGAQLSRVEVNSGMGGVTAKVLQHARHGSLVYPIMSKFLGTGGLLGALCGLVLGYLVEMADRSFRKPDEIIREFGVPIMGHIPFMAAEQLKKVPGSVAFDRSAVSVLLPRSRPAEAYRSVRTAVCFSAVGGSHRVLQVTSPAAGDGKSTLALNLATSLAQSGKRTILVECDFRRPKVHRLTGVENRTGFVNVLRGDCELPDAIRETSLADFCVLPCGVRPKDPAELLSRPSFDEILKVLREKFEYVIIDTPPVLAVTDPCSVAARVDGVLVCMRLSRHTRELGRRTLEQLREVGATVAGIVINGVEERDAYGYGSYRYSDYRYYYKNDNYGDGSYDQEEHADEDAEHDALTHQVSASR